MAKYFSARNLNLLLLSNSDDTLTRPMYTVTLLLTNRKILTITTPKQLCISLFKDFLDLVVLVVSFKNF